MQLVELAESNREEYNRFVAANSGSFLQSWEWGAWQEHLGNKIFRYFVKDSNEAKASIQFIQTPLPGGKMYLYAPYGPVLASGENVNFQFSIFNFQKIFNELELKFPNVIFIRIEPTYNLQSASARQPSRDGLTTYNFLKKSTNIQPAITIVVDVDKSDEELLAAMHPKTRYNIKVAQKHGVDIACHVAGEIDNQDSAIRLITQTQSRQRYRGHSAPYYRNLLDFFGKDRFGALKVKIYTAVYQSKIISAGIMFDFAPTRVYLYGGSSDERRNVMAPYLLHWTALRDARELGLRYYDLGGSEVSGGGERGFTRFKQGFGGRVVNYAGAYDYICNPLWYTVYKTVRIVNRIIKHF